MKPLKRLLFAFALLLLIAAVLPFFISLDDYIPRIEKEAFARLSRSFDRKPVQPEKARLSRKNKPLQR